MPVAPTIAGFVAELNDDCAEIVSDVGLFLDQSQDGSAEVTTSRVVLEGIRRGLRAAGIATANPFTPVDADLVGLSSFACERVRDEALRFILDRVHLNWYRAMEADQVEAYAKAEDTRGGFRYRQEQNLIRRMAALDAKLKTAYQEPASAIAVGEATSDLPNNQGWAGYPSSSVRGPWGFWY